MNRKYPYSSLFKIFKKHLLLSSVVFITYSFLIFILFEKVVSPYVPKEYLFYVVISFVLIGFFISFILLLFILSSFLKPFYQTNEKIKKLTQIVSLKESSLELLKIFERGESEIDHEAFHIIDENLNSIYSHIKKTSFQIDREKAELEAIASAVSDAVIAIDNNKNIIFFNPQSLSFFPKVELHQNIQDVVFSYELLNGCSECLEKGSTIKLELNLNVSEHRQNRICEASISPLNHDLNKKSGAIIVLFDKTEIRNTEKSQIDFVSSVSHELKTPLTSIKGFVETINEDFKKEKYDQIQQFLDIISRNVTRLMNLIDDLLSLSHIDSISALDKQEINTREITLVACETIPTDQHKINFIFHAETVMASRQWLEQVLYNLVYNAVKYTPSGTQIDIIWEKHPHFILLTVKDDGEGIPLQHQHRIFERFYRVEEDRSREKGGTGIGLSIVKQVMEKHGGHVYLTSRRRGKGSKFTCTFPR